MASDSPLAPRPSYWPKVQYRAVACLSSIRTVTKTRLLIAVVDDEESVRIAIRRLLRSANMNAETFPSGAEFLDSMKERQPDCVVLDLHMPQVNGFAVQARLAAAGSRVPVVIITGHDSTESRDRALAGGAAAYLRKPVDDQALLDAIQQAVTQAAAKAGDR